MRILVTKLGDELIKLMTEENLNQIKYKTTDNNLYLETNRQQNKATHIRNVSNNSNKNNKNSLDRSINSKFRGDLLNKLDQDQTKLTAEDLISSKVISIKQKKLNIPKNVTERYNSDNRSSLILPSVTLPKFKDTNSTNFNNTNNFTSTGMQSIKSDFTFRDILSEETCKNLKKRLTAERNMKDRLSRVDETKFRSIFGEKSDSEKLEDMLTKNINSDRINLIKYLNQKTDISDVLIKRISEYSEDKINKVNKICQIVFYNEERSQIFKERINERIAAKKNREKTEYKASIELIGDNIKGISNILKDYERNENKHERFRDIHNDVVNKFWKKYKVNRYEKKSNMYKTQSLVENFSDFNTSPLKNIKSSEYLN